MPRIYTKRIGCIAPGCATQQHYANGYCHVHYARLYRNGDLELHPYHPPKAKIHKCFARGCDRLVRAKSYCPKHAYRAKKLGNPTADINHGQDKAFRAELDVISIFRSKKHRARSLPYIGDGDILVDDSIRIEVKAAEPQRKSAKQGQLFWCFNIHRHGVLKEESDYYIFQFLKVPGLRKPLYAAFKSPLGVLTVNFSIKTLILHVGPAVRLFQDLINAAVPKREGVAA